MFSESRAFCIAVLPRPGDQLKQMGSSNGKRQEEAGLSSCRLPSYFVS